MESLRDEYLEILEAVIKACKQHRDFIREHYADDGDDVAVFEKEWIRFRDDVETGIADCKETLYDMKRYVNAYEVTESEAESDESMQDETECDT